MKSFIFALLLFSVSLIHAQGFLFLIEKYLKKEITSQEHDRLDNWISENESNVRVFEILTETENRKALKAIATALKMRK